MMPSYESRIIHLINATTSPSHIRQIQSQFIHRNLLKNHFITQHFINSCNSLGLLNEAHALILCSKPPSHVFLYNTLFRSLSHSKTPHLPFALYAHMQRASLSPNNYTFPFLLKSLADFQELQKGQMVQIHVIKLGHSRDIYIQNSLMNLYASSGEMGLCRRVFDEMPDPDVVSWTILITGFRNAEKYDAALIAFEHMQYAGVVPNRVTMVNALAACGGLGAFKMGVWIHDFIMKKGWELDVILGTALIDMYGKCGRIEEGLRVFHSMEEKNNFTWNAIINGLALTKNGELAVWWFNRMEQEGFKFDHVTLIGVLSACGHSGLVDTGRQIFRFLVEGRYGFLPGVKHYACMIDLLTRARCLDDAFKLLKEMPFEPTKSIWGSLLTGCRSHGNLELSEIAAKKLVELEPDNSAYYVVLSNLYSDMGRWDDAEKVRTLMKERGMRKGLGFSSVEWESQEQVSEVY
ncbi:DNA mismatch repair protein PMS1-like [Hibiscus syriacus]|uniref:DNA mismatch repair protein PMS1-like n=1 Tax=Hibiscus syriacus TaxID=106335 RepID=A0A6A2Y667_HIBSY|nr:pentatricopeptide repeat-containing protein At2g33760-like [Hibiscus syriacus]KAE8676765.1 DNA mismatch repair protein PMS1-like [Hibiscus syriacus]